ncbi:MAG: hypothetical protein NZM42_03860 [Gemmatales bacterium]|nr:hypothetical protein [Gemmatales bacterium]MDW8223742.1 hypothetical protein [Gemmatales bacterium]
MARCSIPHLLRLTFLGLIAVLILVAAGAGQPLPQDLPRPPNVRGIPDRKAGEDPPDRPDLYTLDFSFKPPRTIEVDLQGRGRRIVWYLWYQVSNDTGDVREFRPRFRWVVITPGREGAYQDEVLPRAVEKIRSVEDPLGVYPLYNSASITAVKIPHVQQFDPQGRRIAFPEYVTAVATWIVATPEEVKTRSRQPNYVNNYVPPDVTDFYIYVYGLSNGFVMIDSPEGKPITKEKVLRLKFKRRGDEFRQHTDQIQYLGYDWIYTSPDIQIPPTKPPGQEAPAP